MKTANTTAIEPKNLEQRLQENPSHLKELIRDSENALSQNVKHFFDNSDMAALLEFLTLPGIKSQLRNKDLEPTYKALQRLQICNHQYREDIERYSAQQNWFENLNNIQNTEV